MQETMLKSFRALVLRRGGGLLLALLFVPSAVRAQDGLGQTQAPKPFVASASNEGALAIKRFQVMPGLRVDLWAAEPMLANPVAFNFDEQAGIHWNTWDFLSPYGRALICPSV